MISTRDKAFLDTNILVYAYSESEPAKQALARRLLTDTEWELLISTQVVGEFINILFRKFACSIPVIRIAIADFRNNFTVAPIHQMTIDGALSIMERYRFSYWDSMIVSSAIENGCSVLYSEDMQHYQRVEECLTIIDPFAENRRS